MSTVFESRPQSEADVRSKLEFQRKLQAVTNRIHATSNAEEIMLELGQDICDLLEADRLTIYALAEDGSSIVSKVKTGLMSFKDLRLPISEHSMAGYVALKKTLLNVCDVYDDAELAGHSPALKFLKEVDKRTGYRTKQMLVAPMLDAASGDVLGVVQAINTRSGEPFPPGAVEGIQNLCETLAIAFKQRQKPQALVRGKYDALVTNGVVSAEEMELAARSARKSGMDIEAVLQEEYQVKTEDIGAALAQYFGIPYEPLRGERIKPIDLLKNLKREFLKSSNWLPLEDRSEGLLILTPDPERVAARSVGNVFPKRRLLYRVCTAREFDTTLNQFFGPDIDTSSIGDLLSGLDQDHDDDSGGTSADDVSLAADNELVKLVNKIIIDAYHQGASDIHIEPYPGKGKTEVRFRKDGSLQHYISVPASYRNAIAARIKIMCDLDISERRKPQDGKIKFRKFGPLDIELRVATVPSQGGIEDIVMRILAAGEPIPLDKLGVSARNLHNLKDTVSKPYGLFFVCGPTGSGKTTTLHSVLGYLNTPDTKIWTAEDPVEITQKGLRQVQMNPKAGLTFATAMKAFLRADPDIIMVGEMRDKETTAIGIEASLTGHLVFATLHTNSAPESIIRLLDMGMDPFNFADALLGVLAQRLAKRLCGKCKKPYTPDQDELKRMLEEYCQELVQTESWQRDPRVAYEAVYRDWMKSFADDQHQFTLYGPVGCEACAGTGYKGRVGLHELLIGSDRVKKLIQEHARVAEIFALALEEGMRTLKQDGIEKVLQGITDLHQVRAVCIK
ncbi:MAG: Flp pilus assembly complex ATPase component TadA [Burkholderiales bacterium]|nr:Flp pilus assembly complex ATPase component TadA [Burkholderiales bacterium]